jgi:hypothetical protein
MAPDGMAPDGMAPDEEGGGVAPADVPPDVPLDRAGAEPWGPAMAAPHMSQ